MFIRRRLPTDTPSCSVKIIQRIAASDESALAELYDLTSKLVFSLIRRIVHDPALAEELTLDTFLQVWRQADRYDPARSVPKTWLLMIARSRAIDSVRSSRRHILEPLDHRLLINRSENIDKVLSSNDWRLRVHSAVKFLTPSQREAIEMAFYAGMTHSEIAVKLGKPLGTVKSHIRTGVRHLRKHLEKELIHQPLPWRQTPILRCANPSQRSRSQYKEGTEPPSCRCKNNSAITKSKYPFPPYSRMEKLPVFTLAKFSQDQPSCFLPEMDVPWANSALNCIPRKR